MWLVWLLPLHASKPACSACFVILNVETNLSLTAPRTRSLTSLCVHCCRLQRWRICTTGTLSSPTRPRASPSSPTTPCGCGFLFRFLVRSPSPFLSLSSLCHVPSLLSPGACVSFRGEISVVFVRGLSGACRRFVCHPMLRFRRPSLRCPLHAAHPYCRI